MHSPARMLFFAYIALADLIYLASLNIRPACLHTNLSANNFCSDGSFLYRYRQAVVNIPTVAAETTEYMFRCMTVRGAALLSPVIVNNVIKTINFFILRPLLLVPLLTHLLGAL